MMNLRVAAAQMEHVDGDVPANLATVERLTRQAAEQDAQIVAFPECCLTGYWHLRRLGRHELATLAEPLFDGPSSQRLGRLAVETGLTIGAGLIEQAPDGQLYNSYVVAMPDGGFARHRKLHAFVSPHLSCGDEFTVFDTPHGCRLGVLICYDNNLIENVRITALLGAEVLLAPHQTGGCKTASPHAMGLVDRAKWDRRAEDSAAIEAEFRGSKGREWLLRWLPSRAHDNGLFMIFSNGVGRDDDEVRTGGAMVLDPYGRILGETWVPREALVVCDLDADLRPTATGTRWLAARRPELYGMLTQRTGRERPTREVRFEGLKPETPHTAHPPG
jgi:predicted amidohydrolase